MFGMKRKALLYDAGDTALLVAVYSKMCGELQDVATELLKQTDELDGREQIFCIAEAVKRGIDAVMFRQVDPYGAEMKNEETPVRAGAMLARAARNLALLNRSTDNSNLRGDIAYQFGVPRPESGRRNPLAVGSNEA